MRTGFDQSGPPPTEPLCVFPSWRIRRTRASAGVVAICPIVFALLCLGASSASSDTTADPVLRFVSSTTEETSVPLSELRMACPPRAVEVDDPYHERAMRYFTMPFRCVLERGFTAQGGADWLRGQELLLRALDGYTRPASGSELLANGAHLAFGEIALMSGSESPPRFTPIDRSQVDPGPFYLVWSGAGQNDPVELPWPYQLATIEVASFPKAFPRTVPKGLEASHPGWTGYALFQQSCASCHAINGQGGKIGPELNVPRSIVEYRPIEEIKSYVRNPEATRYTSMPAHPDLSDADLDTLIAYFEAMSQRKQDPRAEAGS